MIRHVAIFRWVDGLPDDHVEGVAAALDALPASIPEIVHYTHGADLGVNPGTFDYAVVADFASAADQAVYRDHPQHQESIARFIAGFVAERATIQFERGQFELGQDAG